MSTFTDLASRGAGVGVAYLLDGSDDNFSSLAMQLSTHDGKFDASVNYDARIISVGDLQRGFGVDGVVAAGTVSVDLSNIDGALDALITTAYSIRLRWKLRIALYDASNPSDVAVKTLGVFVNLDHPQRSGSSVTLQLADDSFGFGAELAVPPTAAEAMAGALNVLSSDVPVQIAMGGGSVGALLMTPYEPTDTTVKVVICATTDTAGLASDEIESITISGAGLDFRSQRDEWGLASTMRSTNSNGVGSTLFPLWSAAKTASLVKDGRTWRVLYVDLYTQNLLDYLSKEGFLARTSITVGPLGAYPVNVGLSYFNTQVLPAIKFTAQGPRLSSRTYSGSGATTTIRAADIAYDLLRYYSRGLSSGQVNQASFTAASAAFPMYWFKARYVFGFGRFLSEVSSVSVGGALGRSTRDGTSISTIGHLRKALSELCQGGLIDVAVSWDGQFYAHVLANSFAVQSATPAAIEESLMTNIRDSVPSQGQRWAPYNRVIFSSNGRIVDNAAAIASWGQVLPREINDSAVSVVEAFSGTDFGIGTFGAVGTLESAVRPVVQFDYPLDAVNLELGDFISVTWSRGGSGLSAYASAFFRVESLTLHPRQCTVTVSAVWMQDLASQRPYLLDNESLLVRSKGAGAGSATITGGLIKFGGTVDLGAMGVEDGDLLVLKDSSQGAQVFTRFGAWRLIINSSTEAESVQNSEGYYPADGVVVNADWAIVRGATTYPTVITDPPNYPSGGAMYGKQSENGLFSDSTAANVLQAG